jgi:hypothetical protein
MNAHVHDGYFPATVLGPAGRLPAIVAAIKDTDPDITLQAICAWLEAMRECTPRERTSWQRSPVKMLLEPAEGLGAMPQRFVSAPFARENAGVHHNM